jgi:hypothetical protein
MLGQLAESSNSKLVLIPADIQETARGLIGKIKSL